MNEEHRVDLDEDQPAKVAAAIDKTIGFRTNRGNWGTSYRDVVARELVEIIAEYGYKIRAWDKDYLLKIEAQTEALRFLRGAIDRGEF
jgi:hypothetical protein